MKKSIKYVVVFCLLLVMAMPATAFGAEKSCRTGSELCKTNASQLQNMLSGYISRAGINCNKAEFKNIMVKYAPASYSYKPAAPVAAERPLVKQAAPATPPAVQKPAPVNVDKAPAGNYEAQVVDLVNKERIAAGLAPLKYNSALAKVANVKAADLRDKNYFSHTSPTYGSPFDMMKSFGISYSSAGENIAKGYRTPDAVMDGWMNSPGHKANILNSSFTEIGIGYVTDAGGAGYWVQMFIRP
ncbi:hypothetical protein MASR2M70_04320 [Bacillota bacterium]